MAPSMVLFRTSHILTNYVKNCVQNSSNQRSIISSIIGSARHHMSHRERRIIGFSQDQMYSVVSDTKRYPEFLPWCRKSEQIDRHGCVEQVRLTVGFPPFEETYTSRVILEAPSKVRSFSEEGTFFKDMQAQWLFEHCGERSCVLNFNIDFKLKSALQAPIANMFFKQTAIQMSRAFIDRAKQLYGEPSCAEKQLSVN